MRLLLLFTLCATQAWAGGFDRYKGMIDHSPFENTDGDTGLYLAAAYRSEVTAVVVRSFSDAALVEYVEQDTTNADGYRLIKVAWSDLWGKTVADISLDGKLVHLVMVPLAIPMTDDDMP